MKEITVQEAKKILDEDSNSVLIDTRTKEEYDEVKIEGSKLINVQDPNFSEKIKDLDKSKKYIVHCRSGGRSARACEIMEAQGLDVTNVEGGILAWEEAGFAVIRQ